MSLLAQLLFGFFSQCLMLLRDLDRMVWVKLLITVDMFYNVKICQMRKCSEPVYFVYSLFNFFSWIWTAELPPLRFRALEVQQWKNQPPIVVFTKMVNVKWGQEPTATEKPVSK